MKKLLILLLALPTLVSAEIVMGPPLSMMMTSGYVYSSAAATLSQDVLREECDGKAREPARKPPAVEVSVSSRDVQRMARELAQAFPAEHRDDAAKMYGVLFKAYEDHYPHTLSGAMTAMLIGSYAAYNNVEVPDEHSLAVMRQFDAAIRDNPEALQTIADKDRKDAYMQMVMLGMQLVASTIQNKNSGDASVTARQREAGQRNLEEIFGLTPRQITVGSNGLAQR